MSLLTQAVLNNADWCSLICELHDAKGTIKQDIWFTQAQVPAFYPNLITLNPQVETEVVRKLIPDHGAFAIKDSFNTLDLQNLGFTKLFEAQWLTAPASTNAQLSATVVTTEAMLRAWHEAWNSAHMEMFSPALLKRSDVAFLAYLEEGRITAGAILNKSRGVVGISNVFSKSSVNEKFWHALLSSAAHLFPGHPLVGYETGKELRTATRVGFSALGALSVWARKI